MSTQGQSAEAPKKSVLEAYFDFEYQAERRHEFIDGKMVAMAYTSEEHGTIVSNLNRLLGNCLLEKEGEKWVDTEFYEKEDVLQIGECNIPLPEIYRRVKLGDHSTSE